MSPSSASAKVPAMGASLSFDAAALLAAQEQVIERMARGMPLAEALDAVARSVERLAAPAVCSILLLDTDARRLRLGAAPSLPAEYNAALDGFEIGPSAGSCGTAAYTRQSIITTDIATAEFWRAYPELVAMLDRVGLRACWSVPILRHDGTVLGTFAVYHQQAREPTSEERSLLESLSRLVRVALLLHEREAAVADSQAQLRQRIDELEAQSRQLQALAMEAERAKGLLDTMIGVVPASIHYKDRDLRYRLANSYARDIFAKLGGEMIGRRLTEIDSGESSKYQEAIDRWVLSTGQSSAPFEIAHAYVDNSTITWWSVKAPLRPFRDGPVEGVATVALDISAVKAAERALRESQELLEESQRLGKLGYILSDRVNGKVYWSDSLFELLGVPKRPYFLPGESEMFLHPDDRARYRALRDSAPRLDRDFQVEARARRSDGSYGWIQLAGRPRRDAQGTVTSLLIVVQDITESKQAEAALRVSQAQFAGAFHGSADFMAIGRDSDGALVEINRAASQALGWPPAEMIGRSGADLGVWADDDERGTILRRLKDEGAVREFPARLKRQSGEVRDCLITASRFDNDGDGHVFWIVRDVTDSLRAERRIAELNDEVSHSLRQLRAITDSLPVLIGYADANFILRFLNQTGEAWLAVSRQEAVGKRIDQILPPDLVEAGAEAIRNLPRGPVRYERQGRYPDGVSRHVEVVVMSDVGQDGRPRGYLTLITDITERKSTEEQLRQSQRLQAVGQLTGGVAHDFNNLLAVISGNLELLEESLADSPDLRRRIDAAIRATRRGVALTRGLLAFSGRQPLAPIVVDVNGVVREMTELVRRTMRADIEIEFVAGSTWLCEVDPGQLQNVLLNLAVNARDAMPAAGLLTIETADAHLDAAPGDAAVALSGDYVVLAVRDTGAGMPADVAARAFEPFFTTKDVGKGTGLGLSMVYGFAKQSNGQAQIDSEVGKGTTVRVYLPRSVGTPPPPVAPPSAAVGSRAETILVVEDDADVRTLTCIQLRALGYGVLDAPNARDALLLLERNPGISLLLTDLMMPGGMDGMTLGNLAVRRNPGIKVLYMSGYAETLMVDGGGEERGPALLHKPFRKQQLADTVRAVLDRPTG